MTKIPAQDVEASSVPSMARTLSEINRKYGNNTIGTLADMTHVDVQRITTGINSLDIALGGGMPLGRMIELYGLPSAGKSLMSLLTIAQAQKKGLSCVYIDAENSFDPIWALKLGVDVKKLIVTQLSIGEDVIDIIALLLKSQPGVIVIDSVAAMITRAEAEESMEQQFMATKARLLSRGLAKLNTINKKTLLIFINQLRSVVTTWGGGGSTTTGGRSLGHYASIRIEVKKDKDPLTETGAKTNRNIIGQTVLYNITKNKTAIPFKYGSFRLYYNDARIEE